MTSEGENVSQCLTDEDWDKVFARDELPQAKLEHLGECEQCQAFSILLLPDEFRGALDAVEAAQRPKPIDVYEPPYATPVSRSRSIIGVASVLCVCIGMGLGYLVFSPAISSDHMEKDNYAVKKSRAPSKATGVLNRCKPCPHPGVVLVHTFQHATDDQLVKVGKLLEAKDPIKFARQAKRFAAEKTLSSPTHAFFEIPDAPEAHNGRPTARASSAPTQP